MYAPNPQMLNINTGIYWTLKKPTSCRVDDVLFYMLFGIITNRNGLLTCPEGPHVQRDKDAGEQSSPSPGLQLPECCQSMAHTRPDSQNSVWTMVKTESVPLLCRLLRATIPVTIIVVGCSPLPLLSSWWITEHCQLHGCHLGLHVPLPGQGQQAPAKSQHL